MKKKFEFPPSFVRAMKSEFSKENGVHELLAQNCLGAITYFLSSESGATVSARDIVSDIESKNTNKILARAKRILRCQALYNRAWRMYEKHYGIKHSR